MATPSRGEKATIVQPGGKLRCPECEDVGDCFYAFMQLERNEKYRADLNPIYKHRRDHGGCGHVFSPGDPWVMEEYLAGGLVPRALLEDLKATITRLEALIPENDKTHDERSPVST